MTERSERIRESYQPKSEPPKAERSYQPTAKPPQGSVQAPSGGSNVQPPPDKKK